MLSGSKDAESLQDVRAFCELENAFEIYRPTHLHPKQSKFNPKLENKFAWERLTIDPVVKQ